MLIINKKLAILKVPIFFSNNIMDDKEETQRFLHAGNNCIFRTLNFIFRSNVV